MTRLTIQRLGIKENGRLVCGPFPLRMREQDMRQAIRTKERTQLQDKDDPAQKERAPAPSQVKSCLKRSGAQRTPCRPKRMSGTKPERAWFLFEEGASKALSRGNGTPATQHEEPSIAVA